MEYPEVDKEEWFAIERARNKIIKGQAEFLNRLTERIQYAVNQNDRKETPSGS